MKYYDDDSDNIYLRAGQAWQILVTQAKIGQVMNYAELSAEMNWSDHHHVNAALWPIYAYCMRHGLPELNDLVITYGIDRPGHKKEYPLSEVREERERVWDFDWFAVVPPSPEELRAAVEHYEAA